MNRKKQRTHILRLSIYVCLPVQQESETLLCLVVQCQCTIQSASAKRIESTYYSYLKIRQTSLGRTWIVAQDIFQTSRIKYGIVLIIRRSLTRLKAHKMQSPAKGKRELKSLYRSLSARNRSSNQSMKHFQGFSWLRSSQSNVLLATITNCHYLCCR